MATAAPVTMASFVRLSSGSRKTFSIPRAILFDTRLTRLLRNQGMTQLEEFVQHLRIRKNPVLERAVAEAMTINETSFFREAARSNCCALIFCPN